MQLDKETIENLLKNLSKAKFDGICRVILTEYFHFDSLNVDRKGDGGGDWITIPYGGGKRAFVAQATVQDASWKSKCIADAKKAVKNFSCRKYLFLTSRRHDSVDLLEIENQIQDEFDIPASCLGAVEIADILISRKLTSKAFRTAGLNVGIDSKERPDRKEQLLFGALSLSSGAAALRNEVHDDAILYALSSRDLIARDDVINTVIETLQCGVHREGRINARIDSLLTRGAVIKDQDTQYLGLSTETRESLQLAKAVYEEQFTDLSEKINIVIGSFGYSISDKNILADISTYASRAMIAGTIRAAGNAGVSIQNTLLLEQLGEPLDKLKKIIKDTTGNKGTVETVTERVVSVTHAHPLVIRLSQELLHFAIDGINPIHHVKALGVNSWAETDTLLDASVAIPYLCSQLTQPSSGRFSRGATAGVAALLRSGSSLFIPRDYLNEAAVHLLHAVDYCRNFEDTDALVASPNGYVSHYYTLSRDGIAVPHRLIDFLLMLAPSLRNVNSQNIVANIMNDLEAKYSDIGVSKIELGNIPISYIDNVSDNYKRHMSSGKAPRENILINHDSRTLAWMKKRRTEGQHGKLCLTWDELMMSVARDDENSGWTVTPHQAADLITMGSQRDEGALLAVVHELAATRTMHDDLVAKMLDDVVAYAREGKLAWEVVSELSKLRQELHEMALTERTPGEEELRSIADDFWKRHGIDVNRPHERSVVTQKDIDLALEQGNCPTKQ